MNVRPTEASDRPWIREYTRRHWGAEIVVVRGEVIRPEDLAGFVAEDRSGGVLGLVAYALDRRRCEIVTLNSDREGIGVGSALVAAVESRAAAAGCMSVRVITTNDNLRAIGFYERRGYRVIAVHRGAVDRARAIKPSIPEVSADGTPIRDEIELEHDLAEGEERR